MPKGFFTQCFCLLADGSATLESVRNAVQQGNFRVARDIQQNDVEPTFLVAYRPDVNGFALIDVYDQPWPDEMGDPASSPELFAWWSMGHFGPFTFPNGLQRATQQAHACPECVELVQAHQKVIRLRLSYILGAKDDAKVLPEDYDADDELTFLSKLATAISRTPGVLCHFNPNGETLYTSDAFERMFNGATAVEKAPIQLWTNCRFFSLSQRFAFMDIVGNAQMDIPDVEAVFPLDEYEPGAVDYYLRNVSLYLQSVGRELQTGERIDGPGETDLGWSIESLEAGTASPPRAVIRLFPTRHAEEIARALASVRGE